MPVGHKVTVEITDEQIAYLLCSAREGGSNYWARFGHAPYNTAAGSILPLKLPVKIDDIEEGKSYRLDRGNVHKGCKLFVTKGARHYADMVNDHADASTGDVFLQLCIFGELIYG